MKKEFLNACANNNTGNDNCMGMYYVSSPNLTQERINDLLVKRSGQRGKLIQDILPFEEFSAVFRDAARTPGLCPHCQKDLLYDVTQKKGEVIRGYYDGN